MAEERQQIEMEAVDLAALLKAGGATVEQLYECNYQAKDEK